MPLLLFRRVAFSAWHKAVLVLCSAVLFAGFLANPYFAAAQNSHSNGLFTHDMVLGNDNAPIDVIEYASLTCPHCARFHENVFPKIQTNYIDTGKVRFVYREVYFDRPGLWGGLLARCAGESKYFDFIDVLYTKQIDWSRAGTPRHIADKLRAIGRANGLQDTDLDACFQNQPAAEALVNQSRNHMQADGIHATPSFVINGKRYENMSYDDFAQLFDSLTSK